jgi:hypothetical protein
MKSALSLLALCGLLMSGAGGAQAQLAAAGSSRAMSPNAPASTRVHLSHQDCRYGPALGWKSYWHRHPPGDPLHTRPVGCTPRATTRKPNVPYREMPGGPRFPR